MRALVVFTILYCYISGQRIRYISTERPAIMYQNPKYFTYINLTSQRYGRGSPFYYVNLHYDVLVKMDNNILIRYISTEHPSVAYYNPKYFKFANLTSQRYGRGSPFYYVGFHFEVLVTLDNNILVDFVFYEFLSNQYKRSFVQMHFGFCDLILKNDFFGKPMRQGKLNQSCPYLPGEYHLYNMTIPFEQIPRSFPFKKGRIWANITTATGPKEKDVEVLGNGYIDMELREYNKKTKNIL